MFDILGGFVIKFTKPQNLESLENVLSQMKFATVRLDGTVIHGTESLFERVYHSIDLTAYSTNIPRGWDAFSDILWQWVMDCDITKLAVVIDHAKGVLASQPELLFQFAEIAYHLQQIVCKARTEEKEPPLMVRIFLVTS